jgi:hypothetical protein
VVKTGKRRNIMKYLNREIADALCAVITLGFAIKQNKKYGSKMIFQYEKTDDKEKYKKIEKLFALVGANLCMSQSEPQMAMPFIIGSEEGQRWLEDKKTRLIIDHAIINYVSDISDLMNAADRSAPPPMGAYVGGAFTFNGTTVSNMRLVGTSSLDLYKPTYRNPHDEEFAFVESGVPKEGMIQYYYREKQESINNTIGVIKKVIGTRGNQNPTDGKIELTEEINKKPKDYKSGYLYGCCHGMIRSMVAIPKTSNQYYFEIALGSGTTKVSSCVPCAIFMESIGMPASSIHLGRGDCWNIPESCDALYRKLWETAINSYYEKGIEALRVHNALRLHVDGDGKLGDLADKKSDIAFNVFIESHLYKDKERFSERTPGIFLEALTFEGSFIDKISKTFMYAKI